MLRNPAHLALVELEQMLGDNFLLITQNIDNLHECAGNRRIIHMHGELLKVRCSQSGQILEWRDDVTEADRCHCCQFPTMLRPHVVWFGEMPLGMDDIYCILVRADYFLAIGTLGHVCQAAGFVHEARLCGTRTIELNLAPSQVERQFEENTMARLAAVWRSGPASLSTASSPSAAEPSVLLSSGIKLT